jgi:deoxyribodipyrimidine photo-lyase
MNHVPSVRVRACNEAPERPEREYILYWMIAARRTTWNYGLEHAARRASALRKPLLVLEALRADYPWASDRLHRFVLEGMADNAARCARAGVRYYAYVEPERGAGRGLVLALAQRAALVVTDEFPAFFLPRMVARAAEKLDVRLDAVASRLCAAGVLDGVRFSPLLAEDAPRALAGLSIARSAAQSSVESASFPPQRHPAAMAERIRSALAGGR